MTTPDNDFENRLDAVRTKYRGALDALAEYDNERPSTEDAGDGEKEQE